MEVVDRYTGRSKWRARTLLLGRPQQPPPHHFQRLRLLQHLRRVADGVEEYAAFAVVPGPRDRHVELAVWRVRAGRRGEAGYCEDVVRGVNVHVVLLGADRVV